MKFDTIRFTDKLGREVCLRNAEESDASALIDYLRITSAETPYLIREPEEATITLEEEKIFIQRVKDQVSFPYSSNTFVSIRMVPPCFTQCLETKEYLIDLWQTLRYNAPAFQIIKEIII